MLTVTDSNYADTITAGQTVIIDYWADWCGPCHMMAPAFEAADKDYPDVLFGKVNVDEQRPLAEIASIRSIPTLIMYQDGEEVARHIGAADPKTLKLWIDESL